MLCIWEFNYHFFCIAFELNLTRDWNKNNSNYQNNNYRQMS